jgi:hypothetical protein
VYGIVVRPSGRAGRSKEDLQSHSTNTNINALNTARYPTLTLTLLSTAKTNATELGRTRSQRRKVEECVAGPKTSFSNSPTGGARAWRRRARTRGPLHCRIVPHASHFETNLQVSAHQPQLRGALLFACGLLSSIHSFVCYHQLHCTSIISFLRLYPTIYFSWLHRSRGSSPSNRIPHYPAPSIPRNVKPAHNTTSHTSRNSLRQR